MVALQGKMFAEISHSSQTLRSQLLSKMNINVCAFKRGVGKNYKKNYIKPFVVKISSGKKMVWF